MSFSSDKGGKRPPHETALRPYIERKVLSPDTLSSSQRSFADRLVAHAGAPGAILVGALIGEGEWDVRPLVLEKGIVSIIRWSNPGLSSDPEKYFNLKDIYLRLRSTRVAQALSLSFGEVNQQLWVKRKFYPKTLGEERFEIDSTNIIARLTSLVQSLHEVGVLHGHIHGGNCAVENGEPVLFDFGFAGYSPIRRGDLSSAPELLEGSVITLATDVFGCGIIIRDSLNGGVPLQARHIVDSMMSASPKGRPPLVKLLPYFSSNKVVRAEESLQNRIVSHYDPLKQGRLIQGVREDSLDSRRREDPRFEAPTSERVVEQSGSTPRSIRDRLKENSARPAFTAEIPTAPEPEVKVEVPKSPKDTSSSFALNVLLLLLIVLGGAYWWYEERGGGATTPYESYWRSGEVSLMERVANDAISNPDSAAAEVILEDAIAGRVHPRVQDGVLRFTFRPEWRETLSRADREAALRISLIGITPSTPEQVEISEGRHPALLLALVGNIPDNALAKELSSISVSPLSELPDPYGEAFRELDALGVKVLADPLARALCHIFVGTATHQQVESYFAPSHEQEGDGVEEAAKKLALILPALTEYAQLQEVVFETLLNGSSVLEERLRWFNDDTLGLWVNTNKKLVLSLVAGVFPQEEFPFEQNADLTQFSSKSIRKEAGTRVLSKFSARFDLPLLYLRGSEHKFTRQQVVLLLSAMRQKGEASYPLIDTWVQTRPDPQSVLGLLVSDAGIDGLDAFNVEAARYLKDKEWKATLQQLRILASHKDVLVRALAYARLDPKVSDEALILKEAATREPKLNLRASLVEKLEGRSADQEKQ